MQCECLMIPEQLKGATIIKKNAKFEWFPLCPHGTLWSTVPGGHFDQNINRIKKEHFKTNYWYATVSYEQNYN